MSSCPSSSRVTGRASPASRPMPSKGAGRSLQRCCLSLRRGLASKCLCCWRLASCREPSTRPSRAGMPIWFTTRCSSSSREYPYRSSWSSSTTGLKQAACLSLTARRRRVTPLRRSCSRWASTRTSRARLLPRFSARTTQLRPTTIRISLPTWSAAYKGRPTCTRSQRSTLLRAEPALSTQSCSRHRGSFRTPQATPNTRA
mmetsp:Transcript_8277/g.23677  ORF Transcript_8277/g.23677 Transcript_8277/m.23677 type:complete len:201 (-) Transcript_8277:1253-1855(-)